MDTFKNIYERYGKKKIYITLGILLSILHIITLICFYQKNISFSIDGEKFKYVSNKADVVLFKDIEGNLVTINIEERSSSNPLYHIANKYNIEYKGKRIMVDCTHWFEEDITIILSSGEEYKQDWGSVVSAKFMENPRGDEPMEVEFVNRLNMVYDFVKSNDFVVVPFLAIPIIFLGLIGIMYPEKLWKFQNYLSVEGGRPTAYAIYGNRIFGGCILFFAFISPWMVL